MKIRFRSDLMTWQIYQVTSKTTSWVLVYQFTVFISEYWGLFEELGPDGRVSKDNSICVLFYLCFLVLKYIFCTRTHSWYYRFIIFFLQSWLNLLFVIINYPLTNISSYCQGDLMGAGYSIVNICNRILTFIDRACSGFKRK